MNLGKPPKASQALLLPSYMLTSFHTMPSFQSKAMIFADPFDTYGPFHPLLVQFEAER